MLPPVPLIVFHDGILVPLNKPGHELIVVQFHIGRRIPSLSPDWSPEFLGETRVLDSRAYLPIIGRGQMQWQSTCRQKRHRTCVARLRPAFHRLMSLRGGCQVDLTGSHQVKPPGGVFPGEAFCVYKGDFFARTES